MRFLPRGPLCTVLGSRFLVPGPTPNSQPLARAWELRRIAKLACWSGRRSREDDSTALTWRPYATMLDGMKPWETLASARMPDGGELKLVRHPSELAILLDGNRLMTSRMHGSEDVLAVLGCARARTAANPRVLIGGLGMGYTVRAALDVLPPTAEVVVSELVPDIVDWNRGPLADLAGRPLDDPRVRVEVGDVVTLIRESRGAFESVMLDVDNGPAALTAASNAALYDGPGVAAICLSLRPRGMLAVWAIRDDVRFERRLRKAGFTVRREHVPSRPSKRRGLKHTVLLADA